MNINDFNFHKTVVRSRYNRDTAYLIRLSRKHKKYNGQDYMRPTIYFNNQCSTFFGNFIRIGINDKTKQLFVVPAHSPDNDTYNVYKYTVTGCCEVNNKVVLEKLLSWTNNKYIVGNKVTINGQEGILFDANIEYTNR
ncbi:MAG: hypothetical protein IKU15_00160 [Clostridia bacterium]|nr:hypothetical protein [Clostridia bacterium]